jgi:6-phospho-beta-glucosidase
MIGLVQQVKAYEQLTVRAAIAGDRHAALHALMANPLVRTYRTAEALLGALLDANRHLLPRFFPA